MSIVCEEDIVWSEKFLTEEEKDWFFIDETGMLNGPFLTKEDARAALIKYAEQL